MNIQELITQDLRSINKFFTAFSINAKVPLPLPDKPLNPKYQPKVFAYGFIIYPVLLKTGESVGNISAKLSELTLEIAKGRGSNMMPTVRLLVNSSVSLEVSLDNPKRLEITETVPAPGIPFCGLIGKSFDNNTATIEELCLDAHYQTLIAAKSGHGKSVLLKVALSTMLLGTQPELLEVHLIDLKNDDLRPFKTLPHVASFAMTIDNSLDTIDAIYAELNNRIADEVSNNFKTILLVVDEIADLTMNSKEATQKLNTIMRLGRSYRIFGIYATQKPGEKYLKLVNDGFTHRIIGKCDDKTSAYYATSYADSGAERLHQKGSFLICDERLQRVQVPFVTSEILANIVAMIARKYKKSKKNSVSVTESSTATTTTKNQKESVTPVVALVAVSSSDVSSGSSSVLEQAGNSAKNVASVSKVSTIADNLRDSFADFENKAISLAGMIRLAFGQDANTGGSNRTEVLRAIEVLRGERNEEVKED